MLIMERPKAFPYKHINGELMRTLVTFLSTALLAVGLAACTRPAEDKPAEATPPAQAPAPAVAPKEEGLKGEEKK